MGNCKKTELKRIKPLSVLTMVSQYKSWKIKLLRKNNDDEIKNIDVNTILCFHQSTEGR